MKILLILLIGFIYWISRLQIFISPKIVIVCAVIITVYLLILEHKKKI